VRPLRRTASMKLTLNPHPFDGELQVQAAPLEKPQMARHSDSHSALTICHPSISLLMNWKGRIHSPSAKCTCY
jgi:hypothetical protein